MVNKSAAELAAGASPQATTTAAMSGIFAASESLDLVFALDCTGSMGSYIDQAQASVIEMVAEITAAERSDVRFGLVAYRDHKPQETTYVTKVFPFTSDAAAMRSNLRGLSASGGGDAPEAVAAALHEVHRMPWRADATRVCVLIADAPPHGLGVCGDGFPNGCPLGHDPVALAHALAEAGVALYVVGCEPSLLPYRDFFQGLAHATGGQYAPLAGARGLASLVVGGAREELALERAMRAEMDDISAALDSVAEDDESARAETLRSLFARKKTTVASMQRAAGPGGAGAAPAAAAAAAAPVAKVTPTARQVADSPSLAALHKWGYAPSAATAAAHFGSPMRMAMGRPMARGSRRAGVPCAPAAAAAPADAAAAPGGYCSMASPVSLEQCERMVKKMAARSKRK